MDGHDRRIRRSSGRSRCVCCAAVHGRRKLAVELGCPGQTPRNWRAQDEADHGLDAESAIRQAREQVMRTWRSPSIGEGASADG